MSVAVQGATAAGGLVGGGIGIWAVLRFIRWAVEFTAGRVDNRSARLDTRELELEERFNKRLRHVERELDRYRQATMRLVNRMAEVMPQDPVLTDVARILRTAVPLEPLPDDFDELARKAEGAIRDASD